MESQNFKGDPHELKMQASLEAPMLVTSASLDDMYEGGENSEEFLLMLYDSGRMPFSERIGRDAFVAFIRKALIAFPQIGSFESYLFILKEVFGAESEVLFEVPGPGELSIDIAASTDTPFDFLIREFIIDRYVDSTMITDEGDDLVFTGLSGIETEYELELLFSEIFPAGIVRNISLEFFALSLFLGEDDDGEFIVITSDGYELIFIESGDI